MLSDFQKYSGINPLTLQGYISKGFQSPTVIQERKSNIAPIDIFSCLMQNRIIFLGDPIDSEVANIVAAQLIYLDAVSKDDITFYINCPGGNVTDGLVTYDTMQAVKADVNTKEREKFFQMEEYLFINPGVLLQVLLMILLLKPSKLIRTN